jgi:mono/diheme cytochrome c family protein
VLSAASVLCLSTAISGVHVRALAHPQEPNLQQTPARKGPANRDSHIFLGLGAVPDAAAAKRGEPLYAQNCAACHGADARGAQAPNLVRSVVVLHDEKGEEIAQVIKNGRPQGMPAFTSLTDAQRYDIAEYLHMQVELAANRGLYKHSDTMTSGDAAKGKAFFGANCASCHSVTGDLAKVGARYPQPSAMLARIAWPASREARPATVTAGGKKISGTLVHYDDFETTLKTADGSIATWATDSVEVEIPEKLAGHRALLPKYSDDDLHDLTRYLLTLK